MKNLYKQEQLAPLTLLLEGGIDHNGHIAIDAHHSDQPCSPETVFAATAGVVETDGEADALMYSDSLLELLTDALNDADFSDYELVSINGYSIETLKVIADRIIAGDFSDHDIEIILNALKDEIDSDGCFPVLVLITDEFNDDGTPISFETYVCEGADPIVDIEDESLIADDHIYHYDISMRGVIESMLKGQEGQSEVITLSGQSKASLVDILVQQTS